MPARFAAAFAVALSLIIIAPAGAHEGHDHAAPPAASTPASSQAPRADAAAEGCSPSPTATTATRSTARGQPSARGGVGASAVGRGSNG